MRTHVCSLICPTRRQVSTQTNGEGYTVTVSPQKETVVYKNLDDKKEIDPQKQNLFDNAFTKAIPLPTPYPAPSPGRASKLPPTWPIWPTANFSKESFIGIQPCSFIYILHTVICTIQWQNWRGPTKTIWPINHKLFTVWQKKFANLCSKSNSQLFYLLVL